MEINPLSTPMPALPDTVREPPRDAVTPRAVQETQSAEAGENDTRSSSDNEQAESRASTSSNPSLGSIVDVNV